MGHGLRQTKFVGKRHTVPFNAPFGNVRNDVEEVVDGKTLALKLTKTIVELGHFQPVGWMWGGLGCGVRGRNR